jgi:hypothetical protein
MYNNKPMRQRYSIIKGSDYALSGSVEYATQKQRYFIGLTEGMNLVNKRFFDSLDRDNISKVIVTWDELGCKKDDVIVDDTGLKYIVKDTRYEEVTQQNQYLKSNKVSRLWFIGVEADE